MSPSIKLGLLSLVSAAAAIPHSGGGHSKFHSSKATGGAGGYGTGPAAPVVPYPTGGWSGSHNHTHIGHTASGAPGKSPVTTILDTVKSTETVVSTVYATRPGAGGNGNGNGSPNSVGAAAASSGGAAGACGPATVYVTQTNQVTVTVPAGGAGGAAASSAAGYGGGNGNGNSVPAGPASASSSKKHHSSKAQQSSQATAQLPTGAGSVGGGAGGYGTSAAVQAAPSSAQKQLPSLSVSLPKEQVSQPAAYSPSAPAVVASPSKAASSAAASAAQPSASGSTGGSSGGYSGTKRGLAYEQASSLGAFSAGKFGWAYNWNPQPNGNMPNGVQFIPTIHPLTGAYATVDNYKDLITKQHAAGSKTLFTFNEPDKADQANIPIDSFCSSWDQWVTPIINANQGMTVVAPSVSNGNETLSASATGPAVGLYYLELAKQKCPKAAATWSEINIHFYDNYDSDTINRFKTYYENAAKLNPGKNIWVTEVNVNTGFEADAPTFLKQVTSYLDSQSNCAGYSWFKVGSGSARELLKADGSLSTCGSDYVS